MHGVTIVVAVTTICGCGVRKKELAFNNDMRWLEISREEEKGKGNIVPRKFLILISFNS